MIGPRTLDDELHWAQNRREDLIAWMCRQSIKHNNAMLERIAWHDGQAIAEEIRHQARQSWPAINEQIVARRRRGRNKAELLRQALRA